MNPSSATIAAQVEANEAGNAREHAIMQNRPSNEVDVFAAVHCMAIARLQKCRAADDLAEASAKHVAALSALVTP